MDDVNCPYCNAGQDINHDDGYGYQDDRVYEQECNACGKTFVYTTSIIYHYDTTKADCLNGAPHKYAPTRTYPKQHTRMVCEDCDQERPCTAEEMKLILNESNNNTDGTTKNGH